MDVGEEEKLTNWMATAARAAARWLAESFCLDGRAAVAACLVLLVLHHLPYSLVRYGTEQPSGLPCMLRVRAAVDPIVSPAVKWSNAIFHVSDWRAG